MKISKSEDTQDSIYESFSDMSLGMLGIFAILLLMMTFAQKHKIDDLQNKQENIKNLQAKIEDRKQSEELSEQDHLEKILEDRQLRDRWKALLQKTLELNRLKDTVEVRNDIDNSGTAHLSYRPYPDSLFDIDQEKIVLDQRLEISAEAFRELVESVEEPPMNEHAVTFFIETETDIPKWLDQKIKDWEWSFADVKRK